jgi:thiosulfate/3-mercaptopyruvate sulfurtransferase
MASLHSTLAGYRTVLSARWDPGKMEVIETVMENHCDDCHASCGQCHVSQPTSAGGGLLDEHTFLRTPSMTRNCTGCHGSRVKNEYSGRNEGYPADVHLRSGRMACVACHEGAEMHGIGTEGEHRYEGPAAPRCEDCHQESLEAPGNVYHAVHGEVLACQVCHSVAYKNCYNCHVQQSDEGVPYFEIDDSEMAFAIGLNPRVSEERPYKYVPLRHVPIARTSLQFYGEDLLANYDALPTWAYATPHNIQLSTPQTESCEGCHESLEWFLTADRVRPDELTANQAIIVEEVPAIGE